MDPRIIEAFYRCILESVKDSELPMEPSDFLKNHLGLFSDDEFKLNLKYSSFKKIGKLLEHMDRKDVIRYTMQKGQDHKFITSVNRDAAELQDFIP